MTQEAVRMRTGEDDRADARIAVCTIDQRFQLLGEDRKSTRLNSSHQIISYAVFCLKKKIFPLIRCTRFKLLSGSWKIIKTARPRIGRSAAFPSRSVSSSSTNAATATAGAASVRTTT